MLTGAQILMESLTREGVEIIFGFPGGALYDIYDELSRTNIRHSEIHRTSALVSASN